jgi:hypothetical protein
MPSAFISGKDGGTLLEEAGDTEFRGFWSRLIRLVNGCRLNLTSLKSTTKTKANALTARNSLGFKWIQVIIALSGNFHGTRIQRLEKNARAVRGDRWGRRLGGLRTDSRERSPGIKSGSRSKYGFQVEDGR